MMNCCRLKEEIAALSGRLTTADHEMAVVQAELSTEKQGAEQLKRKYRSLEEQNRELVSVNSVFFKII